MDQRSSYVGERVIVSGFVNMISVNTWKSAPGPPVRTALAGLVAGRSASIEPSARGSTDGPGIRLSGALIGQGLPRRKADWEFVEQGFPFLSIAVSTAGEMAAVA